MRAAWRRWKLQRGENRLRLQRAGLNQEYRRRRLRRRSVVHAGACRGFRLPASRERSASRRQLRRPRRAPELDSGHVLVKSPIVGTYYDAPAPGAAPFVKVGDAVEPGQVLCIIESMKLMNEIESEVAGIVASSWSKTDGRWSTERRCSRSVPLG